MRTNKLYSTILTTFFLILGNVFLFAQATSIIKGIVTNACGEPLVGVPINFTGDSTGQVITNENGEYLIEADSGGIYDLFPFIEDNIENGVDTFDLALLREHFLNVDSVMLSPYQLLAGDMSRSGGISSYDLVLLGKVALGLSVPVSAPYWFFIDESYVFPNPQHPWLENIPETFSVDLLQDTVYLNFVGIKLGDVDCSADGVFLSGTLSGKVFNDIDEDCTLGNLETGFEHYLLRFDNGNELFYATTNQSGEYIINLEPGSYTVSLELPNDLWLVCENEVEVNVIEFEFLDLHFGLQPLLEEPFMEVDISTNFLRRCFDNTYSLRYCNSGTAMAENATVIVHFDEFITPISASIPWTVDAQTPNTFSFEIGNVAAQECGWFTINVALSCDAALGQTHCTSAHVFPEPSLLSGPEWDGSSLQLNGSCEGGIVKFQIINVGETMEQPLQYIVIEDDLIMISGEVRLNAGEEKEVIVEANGTTKRLEINQAPGHPGYSQPALSIEACGTNEEGTFSTGFVTQFPEDDADPFISINCQENIGPFDPNDKRAFPKGVGDNHAIEANTALEYQIRFQNVGTDTAFTVVIKDALPEGLDPATFRAGASSHPYRYEICEAGMLNLIFEDIQLPDSLTNEVASHGFIKFRINQKPDHPVGTIIENNAAIYFDFNEPVITNYSWHTIGANFVVADSVDIMGTVTTFTDKPITGAVAQLHPIAFSDTTDNLGEYTFPNVPTQASYSLGVDYEGEPLAGVTTLDLVLIARHILGLQPFTSPYQILAADLNNSGSVSTLDIIFLRRLILGAHDSLSLNWLFIPADFSFPNPNNPWVSPVPTTVEIENLQHDLDIDFIGVKKGDVNGSFEQIIDETPMHFMEVNINESPFPGHFQLDFHMPQVKNIQGLQLEWSLSKALAFTEFIPGSLPGLGPEHYNLKDGTFLLSWNADEGEPLENNALLFSWLVKAKDTKDLENSIFPISNTNNSFIITPDLKQASVGIKLATNVSETLSVFPNPTLKDWTIQVNNQWPSICTLRLYNTQGQLVQTVIQQKYLEAGTWQYVIESENISPGTYWLELKSDTKQEIQRLVKM